jgi:hypothetical protein
MRPVHGARPTGSAGSLNLMQYAVVAMVVTSSTVQCMARPVSLVNEAVAAANRGSAALKPLLQAAGVSMQARHAGSHYL